ncbi:XrtA/PEP-CTERM system amidotransferase [Thiosocius teredinicola]|uniref:XrtA/PEP-CTERM system amidotransferase n=1 Tax=Thiosocius teredinicola TaxID=1973002 RepID=UPI0009910DB5
MCGLVGIFDTRSRRDIDRALLERMNERQFHRGPDEGGLHLEPGVGLGHRRLSIIDLSSGQQPLFNEDQTVVVVYNGEIYNFGGLAEELKALGHTFRTHCDTEVIVHAWEEWGEDCVNRFRGMFAFALWDRNREQLFLARDRLGIKPLYYSLLPNGELVFGSELKAMKEHPQLSRTIDEHAVEDYFALGYVPEPRSIYRDTYKLRPGHTLLLNRGDAKLVQKAYWDVPFAMLGTPMSLEQAEAELVERMREAVDIRLIAEVSLGAFLSGGVDSSSVVAMMAQVSPDPVNTCSIAFGEAEYNEAEYAAAVAEKFGCNHHVGRVDPDDHSLIDLLAGLYDEPFADSSAMPTYRVCELAKRDVTVVLSGDGGDENLAGYRRYGQHLDDLATKAKMPAAMRSLLGAVGSLYPDTPSLPRALQRRQGLISMGQDPVASFFDINAVIKQDLRHRLFSDSFKRRLHGYDAVEVFREHAKAAPTDDPLSLAQYLDLKTYLPGDILTKVDRASMAHALEVRVPLLDHKLVEWISGLPVDLKRRNGEGKYLLKKSMERYLPHDILYRPKKGFAVPLAQWFRGPLRQRLQNALNSDVLHGAGVFDRRGLQRLFEEHDRGQRDWSTPLWSILMFEAFLQAEAA